MGWVSSSSECLIRRKRTLAPARKCNLRAFTLSELWVVVAIIALLVSLLLPTLSEATRLARISVCETNLHYIGLDHLLAQLIENEQVLVAEIERAHRSSTDDPEAARLLEGMLAGERENLKQLQDLIAR